MWSVLQISRHHTDLSSHTSDTNLHSSSSTSRELQLWLAAIRIGWWIPQQPYISRWWGCTQKTRAEHIALFYRWHQGEISLPHSVSRGAFARQSGTRIAYQQDDPLVVRRTRRGPYHQNSSLQLCPYSSLGTGGRKRCLLGFCPGAHHTSWWHFLGPSSLASGEYLPGRRSCTRPYLLASTDGKSLGEVWCRETFPAIPFPGDAASHPMVVQCHVKPAPESDWPDRGAETGWGTHTGNRSKHELLRMLFNSTLNSTMRISGFDSCDPHGRTVSKDLVCLTTTHFLQDTLVVSVSKEIHVGRDYSHVSIGPVDLERVTHYKMVSYGFGPAFDTFCPGLQHILDILMKKTLPNPIWSCRTKMSHKPGQNVLQAGPKTVESQSKCVQPWYNRNLAPSVRRWCNNVRKLPRATADVQK